LKHQINTDLVMNESIDMKPAIGFHMNKEY